MQPLSTPPQPQLTAADRRALEESARYALLRRLAPTIRHHLVGEFQPLGMISAMMDRRLQAEQPNLASLRDNSSALGKLSRTAANTCINLMTWISPKAGVVTRMDSGVLDCLSLLSTEFRFKGLIFLNEVTEMPVDVDSTALRSVLPAALVALSDQGLGAIDVQLQARPVATGVELWITPMASDRAAESSLSSEYRPMTWADVAVLAQAESVGLERTEERICLTFASVPAAGS